MFYSYKENRLHGSLKTEIGEIGGLPRFVEWLLAGGGLIVLFPILLLCAVLVRQSSPGPVLFRQKRVGRAGKVFTLYKFRTMAAAIEGLPITAENDNRITPIGKFLRMTKVDELPELYNVWRGDMALVGPRPEVVELVDFKNPLWETVLRVRPGITDPVTLRLRNEETFLARVEDKEKFYREVVQPFKLNGYIKYLKIKSVRNDVKTILRTFKVIFLPQTAPPPNPEEIKLSYIEH
jgi:lipopolysaccharide/colanic/teichoic acid biosynthesis glycosyltransferase